MKLKTATYILAAISAALIIASFILPPSGVVDNSVIMATGILFAFAALLFGWHAIDKGMDAKITHNNTTIEVTNDDNE